MTYSPQQVSKEMHSNDKYAHKNEIKIITVNSDSAVATVIASSKHLNGHGLCHGGAIFTLADTCFAHACNASNQMNVGQSAIVDYMHPAKLHYVLTAKAIAVAHSGKSSIFTTTVYNQLDKIVAIFHGRAHAISNTIIKD